MKYEQHPLSAAFPLMGEGDLMLMTQDIRENGLREPGVLFEGKILDGWHRYLACTKAKVDFVATEFRGTDPAGYVISRNRHRRHLTLSQISVAVVRCKEWAPAHRPNKGEPGSPLSKVADVAAEVGVSPRTIQQAKVAVAAGLGDAVRDGLMTVKEAVHVAKGTAPKPAKKEVAPEPEPENPHAAEEALQGDIEAAQFKAEFAIFYADDENKHMVDQIRQLTAEVVTLRSRVTGLMNELVVARQSAKSWKAKAEKAEKAAKEAVF